MLMHRNCGGEVREATDGRGYRFDGENARIFGPFVPAYICTKCDKEILGDAEVKVVDPGGKSDIEQIPSLELVSDVCKCGAFRNQHQFGSGNSKRQPSACEKFMFGHRCSSDELERWVKKIVL
jgi:hypothetical protein